MQANLIWINAGAIVYSVPVGTLVFFNGRTVAIPEPGYQSAEVLRADMAKAGIMVCEYPASEAEALAILGLEPQPTMRQLELI